MTREPLLFAPLGGAHARWLDVACYSEPPIWYAAIIARLDGAAYPHYERLHRATDYTDAVRVATDWAEAEGATLREVARTVVT